MEDHRPYERLRSGDRPPGCHHGALYGHRIEGTKKARHGHLPSMVVTPYVPGSTLAPCPARIKRRFDDGRVPSSGRCRSNPSDPSPGILFVERPGPRYLWHGPLCRGVHHGPWTVFPDDRERCDGSRHALPGAGQDPGPVPERGRAVARGRGLHRAFGRSTRLAGVGRRAPTGPAWIRSAARTFGPGAAPVATGQCPAAASSVAERASTDGIDLIDPVPDDAPTALAVSPAAPAHAVAKPGRGAVGSCACSSSSDLAARRPDHGRPARP